MVKYNEAFKMKLVTEYIKGDLGYKRLAKKYNMPSATPLQNWVLTYKAHGTTGLTQKTGKTVYSVQFKLNAIQFMLETGASYQETAVQFNLNTPALIAQWMKVYRNKGTEGLKPKPKGRVPMADQSKKRPTKDLKQLTREELERENELLKLENAYLKKLKAFRVQNAGREKHRQNWHSNSKEKDSD